MGFPQLIDKLEFVGMPPRATRAFARVIIFPSAAHPVRFCGGGLFYITYAVLVEGPKGCGFPGGGGSIFTFEIKGGQEEAHKFIDNLEIFSLLASVADVKSLVIHPATTTHSQLSAEELLDQGIKPNTIRLSIGTEHIDDIIADLQKGFAAVK